MLGVPAFLGSSAVAAEGVAAAAAGRCFCVTFVRVRFTAATAADVAPLSHVADAAAASTAAAARTRRAAATAPRRHPAAAQPDAAYVAAASSPPPLTSAAASASTSYLRFPAASSFLPPPPLCVTAARPASAASPACARPACSLSAVYSLRRAAAPDAACASLSATSSLPPAAGGPFAAASLASLSSCAAAVASPSSRLSLPRCAAAAAAASCCFFHPAASSAVTAAASSVLNLTCTPLPSAAAAACSLRRPSVASPLLLVYGPLCNRFPAVCSFSLRFSSSRISRLLPSSPSPASLSPRGHSFLFSSSSFCLVSTTAFSSSSSGATAAPPAAAAGVPGTPHQQQQQQEEQHRGPPWTALLQVMRRLQQHWRSQSLLQRVCLSSLFLNSCFILFMSRRLWKEQHGGEKLWEDELVSSSSRSADWRCFHLHRIFFNQCKTYSPLLQLFPPHHADTDNLADPQQQQRQPRQLQEERKDQQQQQQQQEEEKEEAERRRQQLVPVDPLCMQLEKQLLRCREEIASLIPPGQETYAMQEINDVTNRPPWMKERPLYTKYFEEKKRKERQQQQRQQPQQQQQQ